MLRTIIGGEVVEIPRDVASGGIEALEAWHKKNNPSYGKPAPKSPKASEPPEAKGGKD